MYVGNVKVRNVETCDVSGKERGVCAIVVFCVQYICKPGFIREKC